MIPGEFICEKGNIEFNANLPKLKLEVGNSGDRPVQVGSHYHFAEVNPCLLFDREAAIGMHLDIAPGTAVRFEPGMKRIVYLVPYKGKRKVIGFRGEVMGKLEKGDDE